MAKKFKNPKNHDLVLTANRLEDGIVVYFTGNGWSTNINDASTSKDAETLEASASNSIVHENFLSVEIIAIEKPAENILPIITRERIRSSGPTIEY